MTPPYRRPGRFLFLAALALAGAAATTPGGVGSGGGPTTAPAAVPASRGGADLVGTKLPALEFDRWLNTGEKGGGPPAGGAVTLYRWWTNTCPFCASSLPAVERLRRAYGPRGLRVVAVYHPKPPRDVPDEAVLAAARRIGFTGVVAVDGDWSELKRLWLSTGRRDATSASFLVDRDGVIRFVHPGPDFFPSDDPGEARQDADHHDLERAIDALLKESSESNDRPTTRPTP